MRVPYLIILLLLCATTLSAQNSVEQQKRVIAAIESQIAQGEKEITSIRRDKSAKESRVRSLASQVEQRNRLLSAQQTQLSLLERDIEESSIRSTQLHEELDAEREAYGQMVREAYRNYRNNNFLSYIFASDNFNDVARRIVNIRRVAHLREQRIKSIDSLSLHLDSTRTHLLGRKATLDSTVVSIKDQRGRIESDIKSARSEITTMSTKEKSALQANALREQKLSTAIEELRKLSKGNSTGASFTSSTSNLNLPVAGGRVKRYMDNMAEVVGDHGAAVISIYEGKVVDVKQNRITGKYDLYIAHGEYITSYAGLKSTSVTKDQKVSKNQTIGEVGASVDVITLNTEYKIIFGIYPPSPKSQMKASDCFKK
ncbi:MAG: peptidoglycan DD-metalloendopeptidase family protein [Rikenellaceae bacterium]